MVLGEPVGKCALSPEPLSSGRATAGGPYLDEVNE
jgi:hypothetical protein